MYVLLVEVGPEALLVVLSAVGTFLLSALGVAAEYNSIQELLHGGNLMAVWYAYVGLMLLAFAWKLASDTLIPKIAGKTGA